MRTATEAPGRLESAQLPDVVVSRLSGHRGGFVRTPDLIASHPCDAVLLSMSLRGVMHISDGVRSEVGATVFCFADRPYLIEAASAYDVVTVRVPLSVLPPRLGRLRHAGLLGPEHGQQVSLLRELSLSILSHDRADAFERRTWSDITVGLLSLLVRGSGDGSSSAKGRTRSATFDAAVEVVERRHRESALSVDDVVRHCGVSRRELELVFAEQGLSPASYVRRVRLRSSLALLDSDTSSETISSIAHQVGFADATTFSRSFRREFGTSPHRWRSDHATGGGLYASSSDGKPIPVVAAPASVGVQGS